MRQPLLPYQCYLALGLFTALPQAWALENPLTDYENCVRREIREGSVSLEEIKDSCSVEYASYADTLPEVFRDRDLVNLDELVKNAIMSKRRGNRR